MFKDSPFVIHSTVFSKTVDEWFSDNGSKTIVMIQLTPPERTRVKGITSVEGMIFFHNRLYLSLFSLFSASEATPLEGEKLCGPLKNAQPGFYCT